MHASRLLTTIVTLFAATSFAATSFAATPRPQVKQQAQPVLQMRQASNVNIDAFEEITRRAKIARSTRLISLEEFKKMGEAPDTIILDTRSKRAFEDLHLKGAVHLNFSDFTASKLEKVLGKDKSRRILIYCNNNFFRESGAAPESLMDKGVGLALNIPTFINLFGYGYENVFELGVQVSVDDKAVSLEGKGKNKLRTR